MVDLWAAAQHPDKAVLFQASFSVRQIEIGLRASRRCSFDSIRVGIACLVDRRWRKWRPSVGILSGEPTLFAGAVTSLMGFSAVTMAVSMPSNILYLRWTVVWPQICGRVRGRAQDGNDD